MKKLVIVILIVVAVLAIVLAVGRPGGSSKSTDPPGWVELLGSLTPKTDVRARDVSGQDCWDGSGVLTAQPGQTCITTLPERANRLRICLEGGPFVARIQGTTYAAQQAGTADDACPGGTAYSLYDDSSRLTVSCGPIGAACILRLV